jgi:hypothetical protein
MGEGELELIKELFNQRFDDFEKHIQGNLAVIEDRLEYLLQNMVAKDRFESKMHNVRRLQEMVENQDHRIGKVEAFVRGFTTVLKWALGIFTAILIGVTIAVITGVLKV